MHGRNVLFVYLYKKSLKLYCKPISCNPNSKKTVKFFFFYTFEQFSLHKCTNLKPIELKILLFGFSVRFGFGSWYFEKLRFGSVRFPYISVRFRFFQEPNRTEPWASLALGTFTEKTLTEKLVYRENSHMQAHTPIQKFLTYSNLINYVIKCFCHGRNTVKSGYYKPVHENVS